jgi:hypothetical protein
MANPATNKVSEDTRFTQQGARPAQKSENERVNTVPNPSLATSRGEAVVTENSENKRIKTVVLP